MFFECVFYEWGDYFILNPLGGSISLAIQQPQPSILVIISILNIAHIVLKEHISIL